jgi:hypothetical protein
MRYMILCLSCVLGLVISFGSCSPAVAGGGDQTVEQAIAQYLQDLGADYYTITPVQKKCVLATFGGVAFCGVYFEQWPLEYIPPGDLAESNVFFMDLNSGEINYLTSPHDLQAFFQTSWPVTGANGKDLLLKNATKTWLLLSKEFSQDGFYSFSKPMVMVDGDTAFGIINVEEGGDGFIMVMVTMEPLGGVSVTEGRHIHPGPRPI